MDKVKNNGIEAAIADIKRSSEKLHFNSSIDTTKTQVSFDSLLTNAIDKVNQLQLESDHVKTRFQLGDPNFSIAQVMVAGEKSSLSLQSLLQISNKFIRAYKEIMSMQI